MGACSLTRPRVVYVLAVCVFLTNRLLEAAEATNTALASWLDDLLVMPLVLGLVLGLQRLRRRDAAWVVPDLQIIAAVLLYAVLFEVLLPRWNAVAVADGWDVAAYAVGALIFRESINRPQASARRVAA